MILKLWQNYDGGEPQLVGEVTEDDVNSPLYAGFPPVWAEGRPLHPADGADYLRAVHEELQRGTFEWPTIEE